MLRKSSGGGGAVKPTQGPPRHLSNPSTGSLSAGSTKTWDMGRASKNNNPLNSIGLESHIVGAPGVDPDYVMQLVNDVRTFADVLLNLKKAFQSKELQEGLQPNVQERLAELLRVLKAVIGKHPSLNSTDILGAAGTVIARVKAIDCREVNPENKKAIFGEIYTSIDTLAFTFGNVVSDFLMGDVDSGPGLGITQTRRSRSFDNLSVDRGGYVSEKSDLAEVALSREEEVDLTLQKNQSGVESALLYAKAWSKYIKDLLAWVEKRLAMDIECAKSYGKMAESAKALLSQQDYMPFSDIYVSTLKKDIEYSQLLVQSVMALQTNKFIQPLSARKNELDKLRKDIKEQWQREQKKMLDAETSVRKARALQAQRKEEYQRARSSTSRSQEEQQQQQTQLPAAAAAAAAAAAGSKQLEKKRRLEEEAMQKAEEAQEQCRSCSADAGARRMDLANAKSTVLTQIRELVFQCDLTLKAVTVNWFQMQQAQNVALPTHFQALSESAKLYEPGERYAEFVRNLPQDMPKGRVHSDSVSSDRFLFHKRSVDGSHSSHGNLSQASGELLSGDEVDTQPGKSNCGGETQALRGPTRAWASGSQGSQSGMCSDSESAGGSSESRSMDSPPTSPGVFKRQLPRTPSTGTMSSADDLDERELPSPSDNGLAEMVTETASSPGPFRNAQMSKAAQSHKLRKLRAPSKCRECDSLVVFHGAECEECSLACHKKCLETLAIQCGHKKLQGRLHLFGIDFAQAAKNSPDGVPFIIRKCTSEIESRALNIKGIYRVNGAKSRVEKLCQAFENGKELVELSDLSPHDISNVLKLYLRQLPEPLILFRHYNDFIGLAKECQRALVEEAEAVRAAAQTGEKRGPGVQLNRVIFKIRDLLHQLPPAHYKTLRFLIAHLHRVTEQAEENKMTASNLGIIFGPTLVKPRQADAEVSLSSLVDYPYQALMVEQLVRHFTAIFDRNAAPLSTSDLLQHGQPSPKLSAPEKEQRLSRHSTSLLDIKESGRVYKRHSTVIPSAHILNETGTDASQPSTLSPPNGIQPPAAGPVTQRSTLVFGRPQLPHSSSSSSMVPKVQLRPQRSRLASRPISMPLERLPAPALNTGDRGPRSSAANSNANAGSSSAERDFSTDTIQETAEPAPSRVSTYYITPYIDTQSMQRRTWDRKYKHYDVTPRTAMIMANLPPASAAVPAAGASTTATATATATASSGVAGGGSSVGAVFPNNPYAASVKSAWSTAAKRTSATDGAPSPLITLRAPRTLQPPPETFYKPPVSAGNQVRTLPNWTAVASAASAAASAAAAAAAASHPSPPSSPCSSQPAGGGASPARASPPPPSRLRSEDSGEGSTDSEASLPFDSLSPPPSSPDDLSPGGVKPVYQRLRSRRLQETEHREAHFV